MKTAWCRLLLLLSWPVLCPALPRLENAVNSAASPDSRIIINADCYGGSEADEVSAGLCYSLNLQSSWQTAAMPRLGAPGFDSTYEQGFTIPGSGAVYYYVRCDDGTNLATQSPYNGANVWPPGDNLLALAADDSTGDANNPEGPYLDLTAAHVGYSADYFYCRLTNNHSSWPLSGGVLGPWFIYSLGFANPEAPSDTWVFSLSYADVPFAFSTGLYLINRYTADYSRIAGIDAAASGNRLSMRCRRTDITTHPRFGPWPNLSGSAVVAANTQSIRISGATLRDTTVPARFYPLRTPFFIVGQNRSPSVYDCRVLPVSGTPETEFDFHCRYSDPDSNLAVTRSVIVDADTHALRPGSHRYWEGVLFSRTLKGFGPGWHRFRFLFSDGWTRVTSPADSFRVSSTGVADRPATPAAGLRVEPNPARRTVRLSLPAGVSSARLVDFTGRDLGLLTSGPNDIRRLAAGVYFVMAGDSGRRIRLLIAR